MTRTASLRVLIALALSLATCAHGPNQGAPREILIRLGTQRLGVGFDPAEVQVPFVPTIRIVFRNDVDPSWRMAHSVAIAASGRGAALVASLRKLPAEDHALHEALRGSPDVLAMTASLEPGASETIEFHPPAPGTYQYVCLVSGHADRMGMVGRLVVGRAP